MTSSHPYELLSPDVVMDAIESLGYVCDARIFPLNSYENRVYQVGLEDDTPIIAKFYRPARWSKAAIQEEHDFLQELHDAELPVVAPLRIDGESVFTWQGFYFALFPRRGGQAPEFSRDDDLELMGRWLGRLHQIGSAQPFQHRSTLNPLHDMQQAQEIVLRSPCLPADYRDLYRDLTNHIVQWLTQHGQHSDHISLRLHGDLHSGNALLRDDILYLVDFDDCCQGPAMQDIWMLLSGNQQEQQQQLHIIADGYNVFRPFPKHEIPLIETLRTRRIVKHAAWLCSRWDDPAFPVAFPWFADGRFWGDHILSLREQIAALQEPALAFYD